MSRHHTVDEAVAVIVGDYSLGNETGKTNLIAGSEIEWARALKTVGMSPDEEGALRGDASTVADRVTVILRRSRGVEITL